MISRESLATLAAVTNRTQQQKKTQNITQFWNSNWRSLPLLSTPKVSESSPGMTVLPKKLKCFIKNYQINPRPKALSTMQCADEQKKISTPLVGRVASTFDDVSPKRSINENSDGMSRMLLFVTGNTCVSFCKLLLD